MKKSFLYLTLLGLFALGLLATNATAQDCNYSGVYDTNWGEMTITHSGSSITGDYTWDSGRIDGTLDGNTLKGGWSESPTYAGPTDAGPIEFYFGDDCASFTGVWAYESTKSGWDGDWAGGGSKVRELPPPVEVPDDPLAEELVKLEEPFPEPAPATDTTDSSEVQAFDDTLETPEKAALVDIANPPRDLIKEKYGLPNVNTASVVGDIYNTATVVPTGGQVFIFRPGQGWRGPLTGDILLWSGEVVHTLGASSAQILFGGTSRMRIAERTTLVIPSPRQEERGVLVRGAINIFENIKRIINNETFEVEGGHSISSIKGTSYILEVDDETQIATYTVSAGRVEVWLKSDPAIKRELLAGDSARITESGIEDNDYTWDSLLTKYDWPDSDLPEAIEPNASDEEENSDGGVGIIMVIVIILASGVYYLATKLRKRST